MAKRRTLVRFDWAMKKLLRYKANFDVLEGFLSELLSEDIKIIRILERGGNKEGGNDKHNRVGIFVEDSKGEFIIIEVQNSKEYDYFHRILYGTSKVITEYIGKGEEYGKVKKVFSVTIAYFDLGQGEDYVYHGITEFKGIHEGDVLHLAQAQKEAYDVEEAYQIYPEYWIIKVDRFNDVIRDKLDEWVYFLKHGELPDTYSAKGLDKAGRKLSEMDLTEEEKRAYDAYLRRLKDIASERHTLMIDAMVLKREMEEEYDGLKGQYDDLRGQYYEMKNQHDELKGQHDELKNQYERREAEMQGKYEKELREQRRKERETIINLSSLGVPVAQIASAINVAEERVREVLDGGL